MDAEVAVKMAIAVPRGDEPGEAGVSYEPPIWAPGEVL